MKQNFMFIRVRDTVPCLVLATFHSKGNLATLQLVNDTDCTIDLEKGTMTSTDAKTEELPLPGKGKRKMRKVQ